MEEQFRPKERVGGSSPSRGTIGVVGESRHSCSILRVSGEGGYKGRSWLFPELNSRSGVG